MLFRILGLTVALTFAACKVSPETVAVVKDNGAAAGSKVDCDLQKMDQRTKEGVAKQIECVGAVVDAVGPGWLKLLKDAGELGLALQEAQSEQVEFEEDPADRDAPASQPPASQPPASPDATAGTGDTTTTPPPSDAPPPTEGEGMGLGLASDSEPGSPAAEAFKTTMSVWEALNKVLDYATKGGKIKPRWLERCAASVTSGSSSIQSATSAVADLVKTKSLSVDAFKSLVEATGNGTKAMFELGQVLTTCTKGNDKKGVAQLNKFIKKLGDGIESLTKSLGAISALVTCTGNITDGAVTLFENSGCAIADLKALSIQTDAVRANAQAFNQNSKQGERQYGANTCAREIKKQSYTQAIGLGVGRPLTDCSACCSGKSFATPGYEGCTDKWKTCMQACGEEFGQNDARLFYSNSAVVDYTGEKCEDSAVPAVPTAPKSRCCWVCRMPQRSNYGWIDCSGAWGCRKEKSANPEGEKIFEENLDAKNQCETKYDLEYHRMKVNTSDCQFLTDEQCK